MIVEKESASDFCVMRELQKTTGAVGKARWRCLQSLRKTIMGTWGRCILKEGVVREKN